jgi:hypothetical protein
MVSTNRESSFPKKFKSSIDSGSPGSRQRRRSGQVAANTQKRKEAKAGEALWRQNVRSS